MPRSVLITGTSSGIGAACVARLATAGWTVFAGVRRPADGERLVAEIPGDVRPLLLDVSDGEAIRDAVEEVRGTVGRAGIDGLVNNAGIGLGGPVELLPLEDWRRQFEVNFFGAVALTLEAFDLVRSARGRFVFVGSDNGRYSPPGVAPYAATKHALEALCESLRHELAASGMRVSLIEPGMVRTPIWEKTAAEVGRLEQGMPVDRREEYADIIAAARGVLREAETKGVAPARVAERVEHALTARRPRARYLVGIDAKLAGGIIARLPDRLRDATFRALLRRYARLGRDGTD